MCSNSPAQSISGSQAAGIETIESRRLSSGPPSPNQSYLVKQMQTVVASCMASMIHELADTAAWAPGVWADPHKVLWYATDWRVSNQKFTFRLNPGARNSYPSVTFTNARWDPEHSDISYGDKKVAQNVIVVNNAKTKVIRGDVPAAVEFGRVAAAPVNTLRQQPHRCQEISVCF